jgi:FkbM family methyltransferase
MNRFYPPSIHETVVDYQLRDGDVVLDIGGYHGEWTAVLLDRNKGVDCHVFIFEPVTEFYDIIRKRFEGDTKVIVIGAALSAFNGQTTVTVDGEGSHVAPYGQETSLLGISDFFKDYSITEVALASINIEGHEYTLVPRIISSGLISKIDKLQIQFHETQSDAVEFRDLIRTRLSETHEEIYCYPFVWESWRKK